MQTYANRGRNSSIRCYEYGKTYIKVQFKTGTPYIYSYDSAGTSNVEEMKRLADSGRGLGSFIMRNCRTLYVK